MVAALPRATRLLGPRAVYKLAGETFAFYGAHGTLTIRNAVVAHAGGWFHTASGTSYLTAIDVEPRVSWLGVALLASPQRMNIEGVVYRRLKGLHSSCPGSISRRAEATLRRWSETS